MCCRHSTRNHIRHSISCCDKNIKSPGLLSLVTQEVVVYLATEHEISALADVPPKYSVISALKKTPE